MIDRLIDRSIRGGRTISSGAKSSGQGGGAARDLLLLLLNAGASGREQGAEASPRAARFLRQTERERERNRGRKERTERGSSIEKNGESEEEQNASVFFSSLL